jgi:hypothetical protein
VATWIFILHMLVPLTGGLQAIEATSLTTAAPTAAAAPDTTEEGLRYRGLERMFAKFEAEP